MFTALLALITSPVLAQAPAEPEVQTAIASHVRYVEIGGSALTWSLNAENVVGDRLALRLGGSYWQRCESQCDHVVRVPVGLSLLGFHGSQRPEFGVVAVPGAVVAGKDGSVRAEHMVSAVAGFRYQPAEGGVVVRASVTPIYTFTEEGTFGIWGGLSFGYTRF